MSPTGKSQKKRSNGNNSGFGSNRSGDSKKNKGQANAEAIKARAYHDALILNLEKLKKSKSSFSLGEQSQLAKLIVAQIIFLDSQEKLDGKEKLCESYQKNLASLGENVKGYTHYIGDDLNPLLLIKILIHELIEDATTVLDITMLPDEIGFNQLDQKFKEKYGDHHIYVSKDHDQKKRDENDAFKNNDN